MAVGVSEDVFRLGVGSLVCKSAGMEIGGYGVRVVFSAPMKDIAMLCSAPAKDIAMLCSAPMKDIAMLCSAPMKEYCNVV